MASIAVSTEAYAVIMMKLVSMPTARAAAFAAPAAFGFGEALQARPMRRSVRTTGIAVTLAMTADELRTQLAYNPELVRGLFATMAPQRPEGVTKLLANSCAALAWYALAISAACSSAPPTRSNRGGAQSRNAAANADVRADDARDLPARW